MAGGAFAAYDDGRGVLGCEPFADVTPDDWAYQAVSELSEEGRFRASDGMFRGERNVTRYEMAQITARLLAKEDQLSDRDRRMTEKLAEEYGGELSSLGVRVRNLEKQQGNISGAGITVCVSSIFWRAWLIRRRISIIVPGTCRVTKMRVCVFLRRQKWLRR